MRVKLSRPSCRARPKSRMRRRPSGSRIKFDGLTSRCTMRFECACWRPSAASAKAFATSE
ncbi:MAG: hypothetical protein HY721_00365 [Planctomycetes bacterium]|nr:hypothetical protein [Planctomycetota bacterium]